MPPNSSQMLIQTSSQFKHTNPNSNSNPKALVPNPNLPEMCCIPIGISAVEDLGGGD
jgi:hypothetical protein